MNAKPADRAWTAIGVGVLAYEVAAALKRWELLSEAADRYRRSRPVTTHLTVLYLAGHLLRRWPQRFDPLHRLAGLLRFQLPRPPVWMHPDCAMLTGPITHHLMAAQETAVDERTRWHISAAIRLVRQVHHRRH